MKVALLVFFGFGLLVGAESKPIKFNPDKDLISLHYDHAPDKDDGHSAAADRTVLESIYGKKWIMEHCVAVSGTYGKNAKTFNPKSDKVMDAVWKDSIGWLAAHTDKEQVIKSLTKRWSTILQAGGDIWVKEGGQSDITAAVVAVLKKEMPELDSTKRIHVVQHSKWNENKTTHDALTYTKKETDYIKIPDANSYLNVKGGDKGFEEAALNHSVFGESWKAAFEYYSPKQRLDYSDTGELFHILSFGEVSVDEFKNRYLK